MRLRCGNAMEVATKHTYTYRIYNIQLNKYPFRSKQHTDYSAFKVVSRLYLSLSLNFKCNRKHFSCHVDRSAIFVLVLLTFCSSVAEWKFHLNIIEYQIIVR